MRHEVRGGLGTLVFQVQAARIRSREILNTMLPSFVVAKMLSASDRDHRQGASLDGLQSFSCGDECKSPHSSACCIYLGAHVYCRMMNVPNAIPYYLCSPPLFLSVLFCDVADFHNLVCAFSLPQVSSVVQLSAADCYSTSGAHAARKSVYTESVPQACCRHVVNVPS